MAHRDEILDQNLATMRNVLKDPDFGARMGGSHAAPASMEHVFCTIQTANAKKIWEQLGRDFYEYIVVDEAHHAPASSYVYRCVIINLWPGKMKTCWSL